MKAGTVSGCRPRGRVGLDGGDGDAHGDDDDNEGNGYVHDDDHVDGGLVVLVRGKATILVSQGKVQASIVRRGRREKQAVPAHRGYQK